jgi:hypothetical protein
LKFTVAWFAGARLPLPETVDCTTPRSAVTILLCVCCELGGGPSSNTAAAMLAKHNTPNTTLIHGLDTRVRRLG